MATQRQVPAELGVVHRQQVDAALDGLPAHRVQTFWLRTARWWGDLVESLEPLYPAPAGVAGRLLVLAAAAYAGRDDDLHLLDERRLLQPDWFQQPEMLGYAAYADRFAAPGTGLGGVTDRVDHLTSLGVTYLHLMPLLNPRPSPNDGGYAVADYRTVRPDLGTVDDLRELAGALREAGISLCLDLVLNHVAREHEWAVAARAGDPARRAYFHVFDDDELPLAYGRTLPEIFPDFAPGSFTRDLDLGGWVWTTFNDYQWDLNWSNPDVLCEMADVVLFLAGLGVEVLRLDAIAFLWKRMGTNCQNQPEVHALAQALKTVTRIACPAVLLLAEAIVAPEDLVAYFGQGRRWGKVSDLAYHNGLMVQIWSSLASRDAGLAAQALTTPPVPSGTAWLTYLRCHDDIGWAVSDADAAAAGLSGHAHRSFLSDFYCGQFPGSFAEGLVFQANPATGDRRISGSAASLLGLERAERDGDGDGGDVDLAVRRLLLGHAVMLGWGGIPVVWSGDEVATLNDPDWADDPAHAADNRWVHRPRLDWGAVKAAEADPDGPAGRVLAGLRSMARTRAALPHLHAAVSSRAMVSPDPGVLAVLRRHPVGALVQLYNLTEEHRSVPGWWLHDLGLPGTAVDHLDTGADRGPARAGGHGDDISMGPYQSRWLSAPSW